MGRPRATDITLDDIGKVYGVTGPMIQYELSIANTKMVYGIKEKMNCSLGQAMLFYSEWLQVDVQELYNNIRPDLKDNLLFEAQKDKLFI